MSTEIIAYYRVSTQRQSLGLDAQQSAVHAYAEQNGLTILEEIAEKESGCEDERKGLNYAIALARKHKATLVVSKADRLTRDLAYSAQLFFKTAGLKIKALNLPDEAHEDALLFGVYYGLAQQERKMISDRTKQALQRKRDSGCKLGAPNAKFTDDMRVKASAQKAYNAETNLANMRASQALRHFYAGASKINLSAGARYLNEQQLYTSTGVFHTAMSVKLLIKRYNITT